MIDGKAEEAAGNGLDMKRKNAEKGMGDMKILYIGPAMGTEKMMEVSKKNFPNLEMDYITYDKYTETPVCLEQYKGKADGILFGGKAPYKAFEMARKEIDIPYDFVSRHDTTLYRALMEAAYVLKCDISRLSIDTYDKKITKRLYQEVGVEFNEENMFFADQDFQQENYADYIVNFHRKLYRERRVCCCITGLEEACRILKEEGIPAIFCLPSEDTMIQSLKNLQLRCIAEKNNENQIVVVAIKLNMPSEYSLLREDEYTYLTQRIKILERLYHFSSRINGVLVEQGKSEFMIFTTKKNLELETKNFKDIYLTDLLREVSVINTYIGIGYGKTAIESKYNAYESIKMAQRHDGSAVYVVFESGEVMGPLESAASGKKKENFDERFYQIARETGLSINTVYKIFSNVAREGQQEFTSKELASICDVSVRTMDRIILKLCDAGYCEVISEKLVGKYGRPSRILRFKPFLLF